jgi:hypothetical protein
LKKRNESNKEVKAVAVNSHYLGKEKQKPLPLNSPFEKGVAGAARRGIDKVRT